MRPTDCTPKVTAKVVAVLEKGGYRSTAARAAGISYESLRKWVRRGEAGESAFVAFSASVKKAEADAEPALTEMVFEAGRVSWQAAMTLMERRWPSRWARRDRIDPKAAAANVGQFKTAREALDYFDRMRPTLELQAAAEKEAAE